MEEILSLTKRARIAESSPRWKFDLTGAIQEHGDACEALWDRLYAMLDEHEGAGRKIVPAPSDEKRQATLEKLAAAHLKSRLPELVRAAMEDFAP